MKRTTNAGILPLETDADKFICFLYLLERNTELRPLIRGPILPIKHALIIWRKIQPVKAPSLLDEEKQQIKAAMLRRLEINTNATETTHQLANPWIKLAPSNRSISDKVRL